MNVRRILPAFVVLFTGALLSCAPDQPGFPEGRAEADLRYLADDELQGRGTPSEGLDAAAGYLADQLQAAGWEPAAGGSYLQPYDVGVYNPATADVRVSINGVELESGQYLLMAMGLRPDETPVEYELVLVGHGVSVPEESADDFRGLDVDGKAVIGLLGAPWELDPAVIHAPDHGLGKAVQAHVRGAQVFIYVSEEFSAGFGGEPGAEVGLISAYSHSPLTQMMEDSRTSAFNTPFLSLGSDVFDQVLEGAAGGTYEELQDRIARGESVSGDMGATIRIEIDAEAPRAVANNVVAVLPGSDPALRDEWIFLSAHYDHLGAFDAPPGEDGIFNGQGGAKRK